MGSVIEEATYQLLSVTPNPELGSLCITLGCVQDMRRICAGNGEYSCGHINMVGLFSCSAGYTANCNAIEVQKTRDCQIWILMDWEEVNDNIFGALRGVYLQIQNGKI